MNSVPVLVVGAIIAFATFLAIGSPGAETAPKSRSPVLVELFTSEGCSSCPPADNYLAELDTTQPIPGAELIVLSEHVDYWNHDGWKDPYSSRFYSDRQNVYGSRFGLSSVYTPEMVVDGSTQFVGSDARAGYKALKVAASSSKISVILSSLSIDTAGVLRGHIESDTLPASFREKEADVFVALLLRHAESQVLRGENAGHRLAHSNVLANLKDLGVLRRGQSFSKDFEFKLESAIDRRNLRCVAFIQEPRQGKVLGAAISSIQENQ